MRLPWRGNWRGERKVLFERQCRKFYIRCLLIAACIHVHSGM